LLALYEMWCKYFITHVILVAAEGLWHLGSLFYDTVFTIGVIYKFTMVWYSAKQGTTHRPRSHLAHLYDEPFLWLQEHRQQHSWVDDFTGQCLLWWLSSRITFVMAALGLPANLVVGRTWLFPASSIKFHTRRSMKSQWVYLAPLEHNSCQLLSTVTSTRWKNNFVVHLKVR